MRRPRVEILFVDGCPNRESTRALIERIAAELSIDAEIRLLEVPNADAAREQRFLGSPTVRVEGRDVEPGADLRREIVVACRLYPGEDGYAGEPAEAWIRRALAEAT